MPITACESLGEYKTIARELVRPRVESLFLNKRKSEGLFCLDGELDPSSLGLKLSQEGISQEEAKTLSSGLLTQLVPKTMDGLDLDVLNYRASRQNSPARNLYHHFQLYSHGNQIIMSFDVGIARLKKDETPIAHTNFSSFFGRGYDELIRDRIIKIAGLIKNPCSVEFLSSRYDRFEDDAALAQAGYLFSPFDSHPLVSK
jgi:hypothetical protein